MTTIIIIIIMIIIKFATQLLNAGQTRAQIRPLPNNLFYSLFV